MNLIEIRSARRKAQITLTHAIRFRKAIQSIYDTMLVRYDSAMKEYKKFDLAYANLTKKTICPSKTKGIPKIKKIIDRKIKTNKIIKTLDSLSIDQLTDLLNQYERKEG